jgi:hypothetical protein
MMLFDGEPSLMETLADPVVKAIMRADHVEPRRLEMSLREVADRIAGAARHTRVEIARHEANIP